MKKALGSMAVVPWAFGFCTILQPSGISSKNPLNTDAINYILYQKWSKNTSEKDIVKNFL
jgi:hypothetical protein